MIIADDKGLPKLNSAARKPKKVEYLVKFSIDCRLLAVHQDSKLLPTLILQQQTKQKSKTSHADKETHINNQEKRNKKRMIFIKRFFSEQIYSYNDQVSNKKKSH